MLRLRSAHKVCSMMLREEAMQLLDGHPKGGTM